MRGATRLTAVRLCTVTMLLSPVVLGRVVAAQQVRVASARVASTVSQWSGPQSGKVILSVEIADLPSAVRSVRSRDQIRVADDDGRMYTPMGVAYRSLGNSNSLVPEYLQTSSARRTRPQYLFLVPPGQTRFVLHVPSRQPVPFSASVDARAFRQ